MKKVIVIFIIFIITLLSFFSFAYTTNAESVTSTIYFLVYLAGLDISYGENIVTINCLPEDSYSKNVSAEGQNDTNPLFIITKTGDYPVSGINTWLDVATPVGFDFKCDDDNTPYGSVILNTTNQTIYSGSLDNDDEVDIWCWCDFDNPQDYVESEISFDVVS